MLPASTALARMFAVYSVAERRNGVGVTLGLWMAARKIGALFEASGSWRIRLGPMGAARDFTDNYIVEMFGRTINASTFVNRDMQFIVIYNRDAESFPCFRDEIKAPWCCH